MFFIPILVIVGIIVGCYGTVIGIGGGPLIAPILILYTDLTPEEVVGTTLIVVLFNVLSGSVAYFKQRRVDLISGTKFGLATIPGAMLGTYIPRFFSMSFLRITFGMLVVFLAGYVLATSYGDSDKVVVDPPRTKKTKDFVKRVLNDSDGQRYIYSFNERLGIGLSFAISSVSTMFGIGGGVIHVPMMIRVLNFPVHIATAT
ncbi:sulfite exporter TauE/SafE family protein, partial [Elusimicrobiota bacterium]